MLAGNFQKVGKAKEFLKIKKTNALFTGVRA
jgi:hypothetical protein